MDTRTCHVESCDQPIPTGDNSTACPGCWNRHEQNLAELPALLDELHTTLSRTDRLGTPTGRRSGDKPLPYNPNASDALTLLYTTLLPWVRDALTANPHDHKLTRNGTYGLSRALLRHIDWLRNTPDGYLCIEETAYAIRVAERAIAGPTPLRYLARCEADTPDGPCTADLYHRAGARHVRCHDCEAIWNVDEKRAYTLTRARSLNQPLHDAIRLLRLCGIDTAPVPRIQRWRLTGRLSTRGHDAQGIPLVNIGELLDLHVGT